MWWKIFVSWLGTTTRGSTPSGWGKLPSWVGPVLCGRGHRIPRLLHLLCLIIVLPSSPPHSSPFSHHVPGFPVGLSTCFLAEMIRMRLSGSQPSSVPSTMVSRLHHCALCFEAVFWVLGALISISQFDWVSMAIRCDGGNKIIPLRNQWTLCVYLEYLFPAREPLPELAPPPPPSSGVPDDEVRPTNFM